MPFVSKAQSRFMFTNHPAMAGEWASMTKSIKALPEHVKAARTIKKKKGYDHETIREAIVKVGG